MSKNPNAEAAANLANKIILEGLKEWKELVEWLATAKAREAELRIQLAEAFIPEAVRKEGVNKITVGNYEIAVDHKINRSIDEAALEAIMPQLPEPYQQLGVLIEYKPRLVMDGYRALSLDEDSALIFSQAMTEKVGMPTLSIELAKELDTESLPPVTLPNKSKNKKSAPKAKATKGRK